jgi:hypothetical protein
VEQVRLAQPVTGKAGSRFLDDRYEGREAWVPPARLKVQWDEVEAFRAGEERWRVVSADGPVSDDDPELQAADAVFEAAALEGAASLEWSNLGVLLVNDPAAAADGLGVELSGFDTDPRAFTDEDGTVVVPWPVALALARQAAPMLAEAILQKVDEEESRAARRAIHGEYYGGRRGQPGDYISPETCARVRLQVDRQGLVVVGVGG